MKPFDNLSNAKRIVKLCSKKDLGAVSLVAINAKKIILYENQIEVRELIDKSVIYPDGIMACWYSFFVHRTKVSKVAGCDLWLKIIEIFNDIGCGKVLIYGGSKPINDKAVTILELSFPKLKFVGLDGYQHCEKYVNNEIRAGEYDMVFCALGSPKQEILIQRMMKERPLSGIFMGIGGSLDVLTSNQLRAPEYMRKLGLEWLYRYLCQPRRVWREIYLGKIFWVILRDLVKKNVIFLR